MKNVFAGIRKKSEEMLKGASSQPAPMASGEMARRTAEMMDGPGGSLTPAERQQINTDTAKAGIRNRTKTQNNMYQKAAFTDTLPGGLEGAQKRVAEGRASLNDLLATGNRSSRYGGFGTTSEQVPDSTMVRGPRGTAVRDQSRMRDRDLTEQEYLDNFNAPNRKMFEESEARKRAIIDQNTKREHEMGLAQIEADAGIKEARIKSEGNMGMATANTAGKDITQAGKHLNDLYTQMSYLTNPGEGGTPATQTQIDAMQARIDLAQRRYEKLTGFSPDDGQGGGDDVNNDIAKAFPGASQQDMAEIQKRLDAGWTLEQLKAAVQ